MAPMDTPEPFYSMTRRAGDTLYLSGFGPVFANRSRMPTRRLVGAGGMYKGILVEIDAIAWLGGAPP